MPAQFYAPYFDRPVLVKNAPLAFTRRIPTGARGVRHHGWNVEVEIAPDLRVTVRVLATGRTLLTGNYDGATVSWHEQPSADAPVTSMDILAADVHSALQLFSKRFVDPRSWSTVPATLARL